MVSRNWCGKLTKASVSRYFPLKCPICVGKCNHNSSIVHKFKSTYQAIQPILFFFTIFFLTFQNLNHLKLCVTYFSGIKKRMTFKLHLFKALVTLLIHSKKESSENNHCYAINYCPWSLKQCFHLSKILLLLLMQTVQSIDVILSRNR